MMQFVIAAPRSGSGKTTVTCALLAALKKRGMDPCAFKSGPDYIDPMFHRSVLGVESHNLDLYLSAKNTVRELYAHYAAGHGAVVCEGAMGFYDGQGRAPAALEALPAPDAVFIGGTKGSMAAVVDTVLAKNANARICIAAIALESLSAAIAALTAHGLSAEVTQLAVSRTRPAGRLHLLTANNPIFLITGERK